MRKSRLVLSLAATCSVVGCSFFGNGGPSVAPTAGGSGAGAQTANTYSGTIQVPQTSPGSSYRTQGLLQPATGTWWVQAVPAQFAPIVQSMQNLDGGLAFLQWVPAFASGMDDATALGMRSDLMKAFQGVEAGFLAMQAGSVLTTEEVTAYINFKNNVYTVEDALNGAANVRAKFGSNTSPAFIADQAALKTINGFLNCVTLAANNAASSGNFSINTTGLLQSCSTSIQTLALPGWKVSRQVQDAPVPRPPELGPELSLNPTLSNSALAKLSSTPQNLTIIASAASSSANTQPPSLSALRAGMTGPSNGVLSTAAKPGASIPVNPITTMILDAIPQNKLAGVDPAALNNLVAEATAHVTTAQLYQAMQGPGAAQQVIAQVAQSDPNLVQLFGQVFPNFVAPTPAPSPTPTATPSPTPTPTPAPTTSPSTTAPSTISAFVSAGNLAYPVDAAATVKVGNTLYLLGGHNGPGVASAPATNSIQQATFDSAGNLGPFTVSSLQLTSARVGAQARIIGNYVYVFGGGSTETYNYLNSIERAPINPDGSLGAFQAVTGTLTTGRQWAGALVTPAYVYLIGGNFSPTNSVERAAINADGSLGSFSIVPGVTLTKARWAFAEATIGNYYYVFGGEGPGPNLYDIERAPINPDGTLGAFSGVSQTTNATGNGGRTVILGGSVYIFGTADMNSVVESASINSDGSIGSFVTSTTLQVSSQVLHPAVYLGPTAVYVLGGWANSGDVATILKAPIQ